MTPSSVLLTIASSEESMMAASQAPTCPSSGSGPGEASCVSHTATLYPKTIRNSLCRPLFRSARRDKSVRTPRLVPVSERGLGQASAKPWAPARGERNADDETTPIENPIPHRRRRARRTDGAEQHPVGLGGQPP